MRYDVNGMPDVWSGEILERLERKGCGLINCRSRLEPQNRVSEEIKRILNKKFGSPR